MGIHVLIEKLAAWYGIPYNLLIVFFGIKRISLQKSKVCNVDNPYENYVLKSIHLYLNHYSNSSRFLLLSKLNVKIQLLF